MAKKQKVRRSITWYWLTLKKLQRAGYYDGHGNTRQPQGALRGSSLNEFVNQAVQEKLDRLFDMNDAEIEAKQLYEQIKELEQEQVRLGDKIHARHRRRARLLEKLNKQGLLDDDLQEMAVALEEGPVDDE